METQGVSGWRKATYSNGGGTACVEVGTTANLVAVRDTKNNGTGPVLRVSADTWRVFLGKIKLATRKDARR